MSRAITFRGGRSERLVQKPFQFWFSPVILTGIFLEWHGHNRVRQNGIFFGSQHSLKEKTVVVFSMVNAISFMERTFIQITNELLLYCSRGLLRSRGQMIHHQYKLGVKVIRSVWIFFCKAQFSTDPIFCVTNEERLFYPVVYAAVFQIENTRALLVHWAQESVHVVICFLLWFIEVITVIALSASINEAFHYR